MKQSKTKYSKFNKYFSTLIKNSENSKLPSLFDSFSNEESFSSGIINIAAINSIKSFSEYGYENIFIETEELYDFFKKTKVITHGDISAQIYEAIKNRKFTQLENIKVGNETYDLRTYNFYIYAPINVLNTALAVTLFVTKKQIEVSENSDVKTIRDYWLKNSLCWTDKISSYYITLNEDIFIQKNKVGWDENNLNDFQVIVNMLFYMNAFPELIHEGVPKRAVLDSEIFQKKRLTITPNVELLRKLEISPHLRRGHFRTYVSDRYKNMRGQTKWIEPVFVKGNSITIEDGVSV